MMGKKCKRCKLFMWKILAFLHFHCVISVNGAFTEIVCRDATMRMRCTKGDEVLVVEAAFYGRRDPVKCPSRDQPTDVRCSLSIALAMTQKRCFRKKSCSVSLSAPPYPDPCPGTDKYLEVLYSCVKSSQIMTMCQVYELQSSPEPAYIISPNYPDLYSGKQKNCISEMTLSRMGYYLSTELLDLEMEARQTSGCYDWLILAEKNNAVNTFNYCGTLTDVKEGLTKVFHHLVITFSPNPINHFRGFLLKAQEISLDKNHTDKAVNHFHKEPIVEQQEHDPDFNQLRFNMQRKNQFEEQAEKHKLRHGKIQRNELAAQQKGDKTKEDFQEADTDQREVDPVADQVMLDEDQDEHPNLAEDSDTNDEAPERDVKTRYAEVLNQSYRQQNKKLIHKKKRRNIEEATGCVHSMVPLPQNAFIKEFKEGKVVELECAKGYAFTNEDQGTLVCRGGRWSGEPGECQVIQCPKPTLLSNGHVTYHSVYVGSEATYVCSQGYFLHGPKRRVCTQAGEWEGSDPSCSQTRTKQKALSPTGEVMVALMIALAVMSLKNRLLRLPRLLSECWQRRTDLPSKTKEQIL